MIWIIVKACPHYAIAHAILVIATNGLYGFQWYDCDIDTKSLAVHYKSCEQSLRPFALCVLRRLFIVISVVVDRTNLPILWLYLMCNFKWPCKAGATVLHAIRRLITARKRSLRRLCFYTCLSFCPQGGGGCYPSMHCRWYPSMPCSRSPGGISLRVNSPSGRIFDILVHHTGLDDDYHQQVV